jgi:hypothetical protein
VVRIRVDVGGAPKLEVVGARDLVGGVSRRDRSDDAYRI